MKWEDIYSDKNHLFSMSCLALWDFALNFVYLVCFSLHMIHYKVFGINFVFLETCKKKKGTLDKVPFGHFSNLLINYIVKKAS